MKFSKDGEWWVSTPVIAGPLDKVQAAAGCKHPVWDEISKSVVATVGGGILTIAERCKECAFAMRVRYRAATPEETKEWENRRAAEQAAGGGVKG